MSNIQIDNRNEYQIIKGYAINTPDWNDNDCIQESPEAEQEVRDHIYKYVNFTLKLTCTGFNARDMRLYYSPEDEDEEDFISEWEDACDDLLTELDLNTYLINHNPSGSVYFVSGKATNLIEFMNKYTDHFGPNGFADDGSEGECFYHEKQEFINYLDALCKDQNENFNFNYLEIKDVNDYSCKLIFQVLDYDHDAYPEIDDVQCTSLEELKNWFVDNYEYFKVYVTFPNGGLDFDDIERYNDEDSFTDRAKEQIDAWENRVDELLDQYNVEKDYEDWESSGTVYSFVGNVNNIINFFQNFDYDYLSENGPQYILRDDIQVIKNWLVDLFPIKRLGFFDEDLNMKLDLLSEQLDNNWLQRTFGIDYDTLEELADKNFDYNFDGTDNQFVLCWDRNKYKGADDTGVCSPWYDNCGWEHFNSLEQMCNYYSEEFIKEWISKFLEWCETHNIWKRPEKGLGFFNETLNESYNISAENFKRIIIKYVLENGYIKGSWNGRYSTASPTVTEINRILRSLNQGEDLTEYLCSLEQYEDINTWVQNTIPSGPMAEWQNKCINSWNKEENLDQDDLKNIVSFVSSYDQQKKFERRNQEKQERERQHQAAIESESNVWAGEVGDNVQFIVKEAKISGWVQPRSYYADSYPIWKIIDMQGRTYSWGDTKQEADIKPGNIIKARIKKLNEFRGIKETQIWKLEITDNSGRNLGFFTESIDKNFTEEEIDNIVAENDDETACKLLFDREKEYVYSLNSYVMFFETAYDKRDINDWPDGYKRLVSRYERYVILFPALRELEDKSEEELENIFDTLDGLNVTSYKWSVLYGNGVEHPLSLARSKSDYCAHSDGTSYTWWKTIKEQIEWCEENGFAKTPKRLGFFDE